MLFILIAIIVAGSILSYKNIISTTVYLVISTCFISFCAVFVMISYIKQKKKIIVVIYTLISIFTIAFNIYFNYELVQFIDIQDDYNKVCENYLIADERTPEMSEEFKITSALYIKTLKEFGVISLVNYLSIFVFISFPPMIDLYINKKTVTNDKVIEI